MPEPAIAGSKENLDEELDRLYKLLGIKTIQQDASKKKLDKRRVSTVEKYRKPPPTDIFYKPGGPRSQNIVDHIFTRYDHLTMEQNKDMGDIVKGQMEGKNPYLVMLKDVLMGYGNPRATSVKQRLLAREMKKRELQTQELNSLRRTFADLGMLDVKNRETDARQQGISAGIEGQGIADEAASQRIEQKNVSDMFRAAKGKELDLAKSKDQKGS